MAIEEELDLAEFAEAFVNGTEYGSDSEYQPLEDDDLVAMIRDQITQVETDSWSLISQQRINSNLHYAHALNGEYIATEGLSNVVFNMTTPAVETVSTYMTKIFCSDKETVIFSPADADLDDAAKQAAMMVNSVLHKYNNGYAVLSECFKDAAINKNSTLKITWQETEQTFEEDWTNITEEQLSVVIAQKEAQGYTCEITKQEVIEEVVETEFETVASSTMSVTIRCTIKKGCPKIECLPPEEFIINEGAVAINDTPTTQFVAHRRLLTRSDVKKMFPYVDETALNSDNTLWYDFETQARHIPDQTYSSYSLSNGSGATQSQFIEVVESWFLCDRNGDGINEWRHTFIAGRTLLSDEEWFGPLPFVSFTYWPIPHKFYGQSAYDKLRDYERSATALLRSEVDSSVMRNTTRIIADPRFVNPRDLQTVKNGVIRALPGFTPQNVMAVPNANYNGNGNQLLQQIFRQAVGEIGIDFISGVVSTDIEKSGNDAAKTAQAIDAASAKVEGYARNFADNCLRDIVWQIFRLLVAHRDEPFVQMLADSVTPGVPFILGQEGYQDAINKADISAKVGLGHMTGQQKVAAATSIMQVIQQFAADPALPLTLPPQAKLNLLNSVMEGWGYDDPEAILGTQEAVMEATGAVLQQRQQQMAMQQQQLQAQQAQLQLQAEMQQQQLALAAQQQQFNQMLQQQDHQADMENIQAKTDKLQAETDKIDLETTLAADPNLVTEVKVSV